MNCEKLVLTKESDILNKYYNVASFSADIDVYFSGLDEPLLVHLGAGKVNVSFEKSAD